METKTERKKGVDTDEERHIETEKECTRARVSLLSDIVIAVVEKESAYIYQRERERER